MPHTYECPLQGLTLCRRKPQVQGRTTPSGGVIDLVRDHRCRVPFDQQSTHGLAVVSPYFRAYAGWVVCSRSGRGRTRCRRPNQARSERPEGCRRRLPAFGPRSSNCRATGQGLERASHFFAPTAGRRALTEDQSIMAVPGGSAASASGDRIRCHRPACSGGSRG